MEGEAEGREVAPAWLPLDAALRAFRQGRVDAELRVVTDVGGTDTFPVSVLFREGGDLDPIDLAAADAARGSVLDVGAGAGALAVLLAGRGHDVTALEPLDAACAELRARGLADVRRGGLERTAPGERFDTVLSLMNGTGLAGTVEGLGPFLSGLAERTTPDGQILIDSTDPRDWVDPDDGRYPGEVHMQLSFDGTTGPPLPYLYVDAELLLDAAASVGLEGRVLLDAGEGRYLARLRPSTSRATAS
ncbi:MAG: hypothetical protein RJQ04_21700 [Longimicrobiales bacterium]